MPRNPYLMTKAWTPEEDDFLIQNRGVLPIIAIATRLDRKTSAVKRRIKALQDEGRISTERVYVGIRGVKKTGTELDRAIVVSELTFLLDLGYRARDKDRIMEGLEVAVEGLTLWEWRQYADAPLSFVCDEMFYFGTP
jgi:DNA-binding Lrp family transcriptional regulator